MKHERQIDRREFTLGAAMAVLAGVAITVSGCSSDSGSPTAPSAPAPSSDKTGNISANHGHAATITSGQLSAGAALTLGIQGTSGHPHTVVLAASDVAAIAANQRVTKESSNDSGHTHTVTFN
jgi:hypothetical protein